MKKYLYDVTMFEYLLEEAENLAKIELWHIPSVFVRGRFKAWKELYERWVLYDLREKPELFEKFADIRFVPIKPGQPTSNIRIIHDVVTCQNGIKEFVKLAKVYKNVL